MSSALRVNSVLQRALVVLAGVAVAAGLAGCANGGTAATAVSGGGGTLPAAKGLGGAVYGGSQPISGATVELLQVGTTGYGSFGGMLASTVTDGGGIWSLTGKYACPSSATLVYLIAKGGNPGLQSGANPQIDLMAVLGACGPVVASPPTVVINEATTVASVYALAQFLGANDGVGSYASSTAGITNAFATVNNLVNTGTGAMLSTTPSGNGVVPTNELNTLADMLATCVNSSGGNAGSGTPCGRLLTDATPGGGTAPLNTLQAALNIALHPQNQVGPLYGLTTTNGPFQPTLPAAPADWSIELNYSNNMQIAAQALAIDGSGDVWSVNSYNGAAAPGLVSKISPTGSLLATNSTYGGGTGVAIDQSGNAWVAVSAGVNGYLPNGNSFAGPFTGNGLSTPSSVAIDGNDNLWITSSGNNTVEELSLSGGAGKYSFVSGNGGYSGGGIANPKSIAMDELGDAWIVNGSTMTGLTPTGAVIAGSPFADVGGGASPGGVAVDGSGDVFYLTDEASDYALKLNYAGSTVTSTQQFSNGLQRPQAVAVDGAGNVWLADVGLTEEMETQGPASGQMVGQGNYGKLNAPTGIAIDGSGNVWVSGAAQTGAQAGAQTTVLSEYVGVATPTITPLSAALQSRQVGVAPGTPVPVVIASGALPYYAVNSAYSAQLYATGGNSGAYIWTATNLPAGITISPTGLVSGTTATSGSSSVTFTAADAANASNSTSKTITLTALGSVTARGNEAALAGGYAVLVDTFHNNVQGGLAEGTAFAASVAFNGSGAVSGELDYTDKGNASTPNATFTGYYTYGGDNRGTLVIVPNVAGANALQFAFSGGTLSGATPQSLRLIEFDDTEAQSNGSNGQMGTGVGRLQSSAAFVAGTLNQSFVFGMQGETPCVLVSGNGCANATVTPFGPLSLVGKFTGNGAGSITFGEEDGAGVNTDYNGITMTGTYTNPDASGRGTITFSYTGTNVPLAPANYVYYLVNAGEMYLLSSDGHASASLLSGDALAQTGTFSTSTLSGNYMGWQTAGYNADGVANYPVETGSQLLVVTASSAGSLTVISDANNAGSVQLEQNDGAPPYTIDANGRVSAGGGNVIFYVANPGRFFGTIQPGTNGGGNPGLFTFQQQTGASFGCADLSGGYGLGQVASVVDTPTLSGEVSFTAGSGTYTLDQDEAGVLTQATTQTSTCGTDSLTTGLGRLLFTSASGKQRAVYTIVQGQRYLTLDLSNSTTPAITILEK